MTAQNQQYSSSVTGAITTTAVGAVYTVQTPAGKDFALGISGTFNATVQVERNRNNGLGWVVVSADPTNATGGPAVYTSAGTLFGADFNIFEPVLGTQFRVNCTAFTSGTINFEFCGQG